MLESGALLGRWQAQRASDPAVRRAMLRIARDEVRHAALAWQVAEWVERRLSPVERAAVQVAQQRSIETLRRELAVAQPQELVVVAGLPRPAESLRLLAELESRLWSERAASAD